jgi:hypothetical protein
MVLQDERIKELEKKLLKTQEEYILLGLHNRFPYTKEITHISDIVDKVVFFGDMNINPNMQEKLPLVLYNTSPHGGFSTGILVAGKTLNLAEYWQDFDNFRMNDDLKLFGLHSEEEDAVLQNFTKLKNGRRYDFSFSGKLHVVGMNESNVGFTLKQGIYSSVVNIGARKVLYDAIEHIDTKKR